ncbi:MAG: hypothetical protein QOI04_1392 [Verrucomicrobiota bacterium]|jgi:hypothetical protein
MWRALNLPGDMSILRRGRFFFCAVALLLALICSASAQTRNDNWQSALTTSGPGPFPLPRSLHATYRFAWSGFTAATADVNWTQIPGDRFQLAGTGQTVGLVRTLWKLDVKYSALADAKTLRPISLNEIENIRAKKTVTDLAFDSRGVFSKRSNGRDPKSPPREKRFNFANLFDLQSSLLYVRSQPLENQNVIQVVVYPATSAYLATVKVIGREKISVHAGNYKAIKLDLQLQRVGKHGQLEPHRKFRRATAWISDDADRLILRIEAQIFVGTVSTEMQSVRFDETRSTITTPAESPAVR